MKTAENRLFASHGLGHRGFSFDGTGWFKLEKLCRSCRKYRRGGAVVEFAVVAPVFFLLVFGMIEYGRMIMVQQILTNASREGARLGVLSGVSDSEVVSTVEKYLDDASISGATVVSTTNPPVVPDYAESKTISVSVPFGQVSWLPSPIFLDGSLQLSSSTTMRCEATN